MFKACLDKNVNGVKLLKTKRVSDERGLFLKNFSAESFENEKIHLSLKEVFFNYSKRNVIRGMHLQIKDAAHDKIVTLIQGHILDVVIDLRPGSSSFCAVQSFDLADEQAVCILIPAGCAHGFLALSEFNIVSYLTTHEHVPGLDSGIRFDSFGFDWPVKDPIVSSRDRQLPSPDEFLKSLQEVER